MTLTIAIISYNTISLTRDCLKSVFADLNRSEHLANDTQVWVADNNSTDGSREMLSTYAKQEPRLKIIFNHKNVGFATANNQIINQTDSEHILLLNSDTLVKPKAISRLVSLLQQHPPDETTSALSSLHLDTDRIGIVAAQLLNPDGSLQRQGGALPSLLSLFFNQFFLDDLPFIGQMLPSVQQPAPQSLQFVPRGWVGGTAMMIRRSVIAEIGDLDAGIFMYGEDVEFCLRASHHHWDIGILPTAQVAHFGSASSSSSRALIGEHLGWRYIWRKHFPGWQLPLLDLLLSTGALLRSVLFATIVPDRNRSLTYWQLTNHRYD